MSVSIGVWAQSLQSGRPRGVQRVAREISSYFKSRDDILYYAVVGINYSYGTVVATCYPLEAYLSVVPPATDERDVYLKNAGLDPIYVASWKLDAILSFECYEEVWSWPKESLGCHLACVVHDLIPLRIEEFPGVDRSRFFRTIGNVVEKSSLLISVSESTAHDLVLSFPNGLKKSTVILNAHGNTLLERIAHNADLLSTVRSKNPDELTVSLVGTVERRKNHQAVFRAVSRIVKSIAPKKLRILVVGDNTVSGDLFGTDFNYLLRKAQEISTVEFTGFVDDTKLGEYYSQSDVLIFPSLWEGFGIPILEAMNFGVPVIVSDVSSHPEVAGPYATYCDPYDVDSIADAVVSVLKTQKSVQSASIANAKAWAKRFSWKRTAKDYEAALFQLVKEQPVAPLSPFTADVGMARSAVPAASVPSALGGVVHVFVDCEEIAGASSSFAVEELLKYVSLVADAGAATIRLVISVAEDVPARIPVNDIHRVLDRLLPQSGAIEMMSFIRMPADGLDAVGFRWISDLVLPRLSGRFANERFTFSLYRELERLILGADIASALFTQRAAKLAGPLVTGRIASAAVMLDESGEEAADALAPYLPLEAGVRIVTLCPDDGRLRPGCNDAVRLPLLPPSPPVSIPNLFEVGDLVSYLAEHECPSIPLGIYTVQALGTYLKSRAPRIDEGIDVLCIVSADDGAERSIARFIEELYIPHLAPQDVKVLVVAFQRPDIAPPSGVPFVHINEQASLGALLAAAGIVVSTSSGDPRSRRDAWRATLAGRPVVMFVTPEEACQDGAAWCAVSDNADVTAEKIFSLLASREECELAAAASRAAGLAAAGRLGTVSRSLGIDWAPAEPALPSAGYTVWQPKLTAVFRNFMNFVHGGQIDEREASELLDALFDPGLILTLRRSVGDRFPDASVDDFLSAVERATNERSPARKPFATVQTALGLSVEIAEPVTWRAVAGAQDCGEAVSACLCDRHWADFESAWRTGQLEQLQRLLTVPFFDVVINVGDHRGKAALHGFDAIEPDWLAALQAAPLSALVAGGRDFTPIPEANVYVTGPVADLRVAYAIAAVAVVPPVRAGGAARYVLETVLAAIVNLRPLVLPNEARALVGRHFPDLASGLELTYGTPAQAIALVSSLHRGNALYSRQVEMMSDLRKRLLSGLDVAVPPQPVLLDQRWMGLGRLIHCVVEEGDAIPLELRIQEMAGRLPVNANPQVLVEWLDALLISRDANLLKTEQTVFKRLVGLTGMEARYLVQIIVKCLTGKDIRFE